MALYKNKNTGAVIEVKCKVGGDWVPVTSEPVTKKKAPVKRNTGRKKDGN